MDFVLLFNVDFNWVDLDQFGQCGNLLIQGQSPVTSLICINMYNGFFSEKVCDSVVF
jgi:hypothetical protein